MRYLILLKAVNVPDSPPPPELMAAIATLGAEATNAGVLLDTQGLQPSSAGTRIRLAGGQLSSTDGPFAEANELISYALYDVRAREDAMEWTTRFLAAHRDLWPGWEGEADILAVFPPGGPAASGAS